MRVLRETARSRLPGIMAALALVLALGVPAYAQDGKGEPLPDPLGFRWSTISYNTAEDATDYVVMSGSGWLVDGEIAASGSYNHYSGAEGDDTCVVPRELLGYGIWKTTGYSQVELIGEFGSVAGGTIAIEGRLKPKEVKNSQAVPALLTLNASIQTGGVMTVQPEGAYIEAASGQTFAPASNLSDCGTELGGGAVEFVIYESDRSFLTPGGEPSGGAAAAAAGAAASEQQASSGGGNKSRSTEQGSVQKAKGGKKAEAQKADREQSEAEDPEEVTKNEGGGQPTENKGSGQVASPDTTPPPEQVVENTSDQPTKDDSGQAASGDGGQEQDEEEES